MREKEQLILTFGGGENQVSLIRPANERYRTVVIASLGDHLGNARPTS